jgi:hypothetical protein
MRSWHQLRTAAAVAAAAGAAALAPPQPAALAEFAAWLWRPAALPFVWRAQREAMEHGDSSEAFARAQQVMALLPRWSDGYIAFAYRYALAPAATAAPPAAAAEFAHRRLQLALAWLESARPRVGRREVDLLQLAAYLPEVACRNCPPLAERLRQTGGPAALADRYLAALAQRYPSAATTEQRIFFAPQLAAGLLDAGQANAAIEVLQHAMAQSRHVRDQALAAEWQRRVGEVVAVLQGDRTIDLTAVRADDRMAPLVPHLR